MIFKKLLSKKGFTLVELLASVAILALIISPLIHSFITSATTSRRSHIVGDATLASRNILETIRARGTDWLLRDDFMWTKVDDNVFKTEGYSAGMSVFDVRVTLEADRFDDINNTAIPLNSPIDVIFARPSSDFDKIILNVHLESSIAKIEVRGEEQNVFDEFNNLPIEVLLDEFRVSYDSGADDVINVYLCLPLDVVKEIEINNDEGVKLNVFIVNQPSIICNITVKVNVSELVHGRTQIRSDETNIDWIATAGGTTYGAKKPSSLVVTEQHPRMFRVTVEVFEREHSFAAERRLLRSEAAQLD